MSENEIKALDFTLESTNQVYHFLTALLAEAHIKLNPQPESEKNETKH